MPDWASADWTFRRHARVVHDVQIVVEEQERQRRLFDDDGAAFRVLRPLVLRKGADGALGYVVA